MGNYSYISDEQGCELDFDKLKTEMERLGIPDYLDAETFEKLKTSGLGEMMSGWKIQGYWYDNYCKFLYACLMAMKFKEGQEGEGYNLIEMEEEQGFKFWLHFFADETGKRTLRVEYVPMDTEHFFINERGEQCNEQGVKV